MELPEGACHVWWASRVLADDRLARVLSGGERERWRRFRRAPDRDRYLVSHALARIALGGYLGIAPHLVETYAVCAHCGGPHGKPRLREGGLEFSISHSGDLAAVAVTRGVPVGVDVERLIEPSRDIDGLIREVLGEGEDAGADRPAGLTAYWTRKEAALKTTGDGLSVAPRKVTVAPPDRPAAVLSWPGRPHVHLYDLRPAPGHFGCLGALAPVRVDERDAAVLLERG